MLISMTFEIMGCVWIDVLGVFISPLHFFFGCYNYINDIWDCGLGITWHVWFLYVLSFSCLDCLSNNVGDFQNFIRIVRDDICLFTFILNQEPFRLYLAYVSTVFWHKKVYITNFVSRIKNQHTNLCLCNLVNIILPSINVLSLSK